MVDYELASAHSLACSYLYGSKAHPYLLELVPFICSFKFHVFVKFVRPPSITIKIIEDFPQAVLGYYYNTEVRSNQEAVFSATVSLIILFRLILYYGYTMTNESVKEIKDGTKQKERALHRLYGDITPGQAVWMTCAQPWIMSFYVMTGPFTIIWQMPKRRVTSAAHVAPSGRGLKL